MNQKQKVAIVTGANRGIGLEVCRQLLDRNFHVILTARDTVKGQTACDQLAKKHANVEFFKLDVTLQQDVDQLVDHLHAVGQACDVLINNAGIFPDPRDFEKSTYSSILDAEIETIEKGMQTNAYGVLRMCQAIIPFMLKQQYGRIVNLSSGMGQLSEMNGCCPGYRISKTAVNVITRVIADEISGTNVLINSMCPGWVKTDMGGPGATLELPEGADTAVWLAMLPDGGPSGLFFRNRTPIPW